MSSEERDIGFWAGVMMDYRALAVNICCGLLKDRDAAEDVVQAILVAIVEKITRGDLSFASREHARNYLLKSIRNKAQDVMKSGERWSPEGEEVLSQAEEPREDPLAALISREEEEKRNRDLAEMARCLASLGRGEREVLTYRFVNGMKYREISELTGIPITTLKSREDSALSKLRKKLVNSRPRT